MEMANFEAALDQADWVITGEGQLDSQTLAGKTINGVIKSAKTKNVPVAAFCGSVNITIEQLNEMGLDYAVSILNEVGDLEKAKAHSYKNLELASYNFARLLKQSLGLVFLVHSMFKRIPYRWPFAFQNGKTPPCPGSFPDHRSYDFVKCHLVWRPGAKWRSGKDGCGNVSETPPQWH